MPVKVTVNLPDHTVEALKQMASDMGTNITEALRQVIDSEYYLRSQVLAGKNLLIEDPKTRTTERVVFSSWKSPQQTQK